MTSASCRASSARSTSRRIRCAIAKRWSAREAIRSTYAVRSPVAAASTRGRDPSGGGASWCRDAHGERLPLGMVNSAGRVFIPRHRRTAVCAWRRIGRSKTSAASIDRRRPSTNTADHDPPQIHPWTTRRVGRLRRGRRSWTRPWRYLEAGSAKAPLTAIAERADVSRGTILHHFGSADGLLEAVIANLLPMLALPDERIFDGVVGTEGRVRAYVASMVAFFRRTTRWWQVFESEMARPAAKAGEAEYWSALASRSGGTGADRGDCVSADQYSASPAFAAGRAISDSKTSTGRGCAGRRRPSRRRTPAPAPRSRRRHGSPLVRQRQHREQVRDHRLEQPVGTAEVVEDRAPRDIGSLGNRGQRCLRGAGLDDAAMAASEMAVRVAGAQLGASSEGVSRGGRDGGVR